MPFVVVDTNCLMRDYLLIEANMQTFLRGCERSHIAVYFPDVVIDELVGNYERDVTRLASEHRSVALKLQRLGVRAKVDDVDIKDEVEKYRRHLHQMMQHHKVTLAPYPDISAKALVEASYSGRKPFKDSGEGFKDYLIFETIKGLVAKGNGEGWFITANTKDFCGSDGKLHADLQAALPKSTSLSVINSTHEFNTVVLAPQLQVLESIAERIKSGTFDGFDLSNRLTDLFIAELCNKYHPIEDSGTPLDEPTVQGVDAPQTETLTVSRLDEDQLLLELKGTIELELFGFIEKSNWYSMSDEASEGIHIDDHDWNDWVVSASTTTSFEFSMTVIFDETEKKPHEVSIELTPSDDLD